MPWMTSKKDGHCAECGDEIEVGQKIYFNGKAYDEGCGEVEAKADQPVPKKVRK